MQAARRFATVAVDAASKSHHKVLVIGGGKLTNPSSAHRAPLNIEFRDWRSWCCSANSCILELWWEKVQGRRYRHRRCRGMASLPTRMDTCWLGPKAKGRTTQAPWLIDSGWIDYTSCREGEDVQSGRKLGHHGDWPRADV